MLRRPNASLQRFRINSNGLSRSKLRQRLTTAGLTARNKTWDWPSWKNAPEGPIRKPDVSVAKNYLNDDEIDTLNRLVVIFLDTAELRAKNRIDITMNFWRKNADTIIQSNDFSLLFLPYLRYIFRKSKKKDKEIGKYFDFLPQDKRFLKKPF